MLEILQFIFSSFWIWVGTVILLIILACVIPNIDIGTKNYYYAEKDKKDKDYSKE